MDKVEIDDIKNLNKKQMILLTLLITFVVSIATGVITVSIMNQMPKAVPQTINNVIQRTIEKVSTIETNTETDIKDNDIKNSSDNSVSFGDNSSLIKIYKHDYTLSEGLESTPIDSGVLIGEAGLILTEGGSFETDVDYKIVLGNKLFNASILKKFTNGFTIMKISAISEDDNKDNTDESSKVDNTQQ